jgi:Tol biopolymer transport system component
MGQSRQETVTEGLAMTRTGAAAVAAFLIVLAGCTGTPSATGSSAASRLPGSPGATGVAPSTAGSTPTASGSATTVGRLPIGRIVFDRLSGGTEGTFDGMFTLGMDGVEEEVKLPVAPDFASGVWSGDGRKLLVDSFTDPVGGAVGILDDQSGQLTALAPKGLANGLDCSDWSPDDRTLVCGYGSPDKVRDGIYLVDVASARATRLTTSQDHDTVGTAGECGGGESRGVYSPDGRRIAYERQRCGTGPDPSSDEAGAVVVIGVDGSSPRTIVPFGGVRTHPGGEISWSPDGSLIAFGTQDGDLSVVGADGSGLRRIPVPQTADGGFAYGPAWSPDGKWLLVAVGGNGSSDLYAVALEGSDAIQLTSTGLTEAYTDWGPPAT